METEEQEISQAVVAVYDKPEPQQTEPTPDNSIQDLAQNYENVSQFCLQKLIEKRKQGKNLTVKSEKILVCKEIQNEAQRIFGSCSYQLVESQVKKALKADLQENSETVTTDGNTIKKSPVKQLERPKKIVNAEETEKKLELIPKQPADTAADELIIEFTLTDAADFISMLGLPKPQQKRLKAMAKRIVAFNQMKVQAGKPDEQINIPDTFMKYCLYIGIVVTFLKPAVDKWFTSSKDKPKGKPRESSQDLT